jgi:hypothetical protein
MGGTVITLSSRISLDDAERMVRDRLERDRQVTVAGKGGRLDRRLHRLHTRLRDDPALEVRGWSGQADGVTHLTVARPGEGVAWWGAPKVGNGAPPSGEPGG